MGLSGYAYLALACKHYVRLISLCPRSSQLFIVSSFSVQCKKTDVVHLAYFDDALPTHDKNLKKSQI